MCVGSLLKIKSFIDVVIILPVESSHNKRDLIKKQRKKKGPYLYGTATLKNSLVTSYRTDPTLTIICSDQTLWYLP